MGWIFFKPTYTRMELVDRDDLDRDPGELHFFFGTSNLIRFSLSSRTLSTQILQYE